MNKIFTTFKNVEERFDKIPRTYYWFWGGVVPASIFFLVYYTINPYFITTSGVERAVTTLLLILSLTVVFALSTISIIFVAILCIVVLTVLRKRILALKIMFYDYPKMWSEKVSKDNADDIVSIGLRIIIREELEEIMKNKDTQANKETKEGISKANEAYQNQQEIIQTQQDQIQDLSKQLKEVKEEITKRRNELN